MSIVDAILLGITQGITEFLPISSDGHLVVLQRFLQIEAVGRDALGFDILLHCGSLLAIALGFRDQWVALVRGLYMRDAASWRLAMLVAVATVPGVFAGVLLQDSVAEMRSLTAAAVGFLITAGCLIGGEWFGKKQQHREHVPGVFHALIIGIAQAAAILPGVSRSGLTVATGRTFGIRRESALNFSFLMAMPIIAGAVMKTVLDVLDGEVVFPVVSVAVSGFIASLIVSLAAILFLRRFVRTHSFAWFAWYLIPLALVLLMEDSGLRRFLDEPHAREAVRGFGAAAVFLFAFMEVIPPFSIVSPGVSALIVAGSLAPDSLSLLFFIVAAVSASFLGNIVLYIAGHYTGPALERALRISNSHRIRAEAFIQRAGLWAVVGGQFFSVLRPTVAFTAGVLRMSRHRFAFAAFLGAMLWGSSALIAGYALQEHLRIVISTVVTVGAVILIGFGIVALIEWWRMRRRG